ncbi:hypothetical protein ACFQ9X_28480 [Catenulispora yoronensis]
MCETASVPSSMASTAVMMPSSEGGANATVPPSARAHQVQPIAASKVSCQIIRNLRTGSG